MATKGGARPGAGRPKGVPNRKAHPADPKTSDAVAFLEAAVRGDIEMGMALRVICAKTLLPYQHEKVRAPVESPPPKRMREIAERLIEDKVLADFNKRADAIRARHAAKKGLK